MDRTRPKSKIHCAADPARTGSYDNDPSLVW